MPYAVGMAEGRDRTWLWFVLALVLLVLGAVIPSIYFFTK
jgi:membrane protein implicated in regulation of membrane protease activity